MRSRLSSLRNVSFKSRKSLTRALLMAMGTAGAPAVAQTVISWNFAGTDFATAANWTGATVPSNNLTSHIASFGSASVGGTYTVTLAANRSVGGLVLASGGNAGIAFGGAGVLTLGASGLNNARTSATADNRLAISSSLALGAASTFTSAGGEIQATGPISLGSNLLTLAGTGTRTNSLGGIISGTGGLTKSGVGTWTLSGANTYSGATTINAGTLRLGAANVIPNASALTLKTVTAGGSATLDLNDFDETIGALTIDTSLMSNSTVTIRTGVGTLNLGGNVSLTAVNNSSGLASITGNLSLGSATRTFDIGSNGSSGNPSLTISADISGSGGLTKTGVGILSLSGDNTYTGATTVSAGILEVTSLNALNGGGSLSIASGATLKLQGVADFSTPINLAGILYVSDPLTPQVLRDVASPITITGAVTMTGLANRRLTGVISGAAGVSLTKTDTYDLIFTGANTYAGATIINRGALISGASDVLPDTTVVTLSRIDTTNGAPPVLDLAGFSDTIAGLAFNGSTYVYSTSSANQVKTGAGTLTVLGNISYDATNGPIGSTISGNLALGGATRTFSIADSTNTTTELTVSAALSNGTGGLTKTGAGTLVLSGANTYAGTTTVSAGSLIAQASAAAFGTGPLSLGGGTAGIQSDTSLDLDRPATVTASSSVSGDRIGAGSGSGITHGFGTLSIGAFTLSSLAGSNVTSGTIELAFDATTLTGAPTFSSGANSRLVFGSITGTNQNVTFTGAGDAAVTGGFSTGTGTLTKSGAGTLVLGGATSYSGLTTVSGGTLAFADDGVLGSGNLLLNGGVLAQSGSFGRALGTGAGQVRFGASGGGFAAIGAPLEVSSFTGTPVWGTTTNFLPSGGTLFLNSVAADDVVTWSTPFSLGTAARTVQVDDNTSSNRDRAVISGIISSGTGGALTKTGAGVLELTAANTYTGVTTISGGTLAVSGSGAIGAANLTLNGGVLARSGSFTRTLGTGAGLIQFGASGGGFAAFGGPLTVSGFTGTPTWGTTTSFLPSGAPLHLGSILADDVVTWSTPFSLGTAARTIQVADNTGSTADRAVIGGVISSGVGGALTKTGAGVLELAAANTYTGLTTVSAGTLRLGHVGALGTTDAGTTVGSGGTLDLNGVTLSTAEPLTLSGAGVNGSGALVNSSATAATYSGLLTLAAAASVVADSGDITLSHTGTITGSTFGLTLGGSGNGRVESVIGTGTGGITKTGEGTWTLARANTYTGATTVAGGVLRLGINNPFSTGNVVVADATPGGSALLDFDGYSASVNGLFFGGTGATPGAINVLSTGTGVLTVNGSVNTNATNGPLGATLSGNLALAASRSFSIARSAALAELEPDLTVSAVISGAGGVSKSNSGTLLLTGANTNTGPTTVVSGSLLVSHDSALGTDAAGTTVNSGAVLALRGGITIAAEPLSLSGTGLSGAGALRSASGVNAMNGPITLAASSSVAVDADSLTLGGVIAGTSGRSLTKVGAGDLVLTGANTYLGGTTLSAGRTFANNLAGSAFGTGAVSVGSGATLGGSGFIGGLVTLNTGAVLAPGNSPGTLTFDSGLSLSAGSVLDFELGTVSDLIRVTAGTLSGPASGTVTVNLTDSGSFTAGTYTLIDADGAALTSIGASSFTIGTLGTGLSSYTFSFSRVGDLIRLTASSGSPIPEPSTYAALAGLGALALAAVRRRRRSGR